MIVVTSLHLYYLNLLNLHHLILTYDSQINSLLFIIQLKSKFILYIRFLVARQYLES